MAKNEYQINRTAYGIVDINDASSATTSIATGCIVPAGAIVTGLRINANTAAVLTNASATIVPKIGSVALAATTNMSDLPAQTVPTIVDLATTDGIHIATEGELVLDMGTTNTSTASGTFEYFVD